MHRQKVCIARRGPARGSGVRNGVELLGPSKTGCLAQRLGEGWLRDVLHDARHGTLAGRVRTGATFADAVAEPLRYVEVDRPVVPSGR